MEFQQSDIKLDFDDVLIIPKRSSLKSRQEVDIEREFTLKHAGGTWKGVPIVAANMDSTGSFVMAKTLKNLNMCTALHKHYSVDKLVGFFQDGEMDRNVFISAGNRKEDFEKIASVRQKILSCNPSSLFPYMLCLDVANGYTQDFVNTVTKYRKVYPNSVIMAGNVVTANMTEELILNVGVDIVKIGIGGGSACTTRLVAGVGYPQLSAVIECADAAHGVRGLICSDGGCKTPADVSKAMGGGADFVMLGGMLSGTDECEGEWIREHDKTYFQFYGMSSKQAQDKYYGGVASYKAPEGKTVKIPYKGSVKEIIQNIKGGLSSTCTYVGATKLKSLNKCTTFIRVNRTHNRVYEKD